MLVKNPIGLSTCRISNSILLSTKFSSVQSPVGVSTDRISNSTKLYFVQ